jgi:hypothetical protein
MYLVAIAWIYVVLMMSVAEATHSNGTLLGAIITFVLYGVMPLAIVMYLLATPARRAAKRAAEREARENPGPPASGQAPDGGDHAAGDAVAAERKEA